MTDAADGVQVPDLGHALGALFRSYADSATTALDGLPGGPRGYQVLLVAASGTCRNQADIAASLGLDRTVMTYLVDDLEKVGLVERRPDPVDRRARQIVLTTLGTKTFETATAQLREVERHVLAGLDDDETATFRRLLQRVTDGAPALDHSACDAAAC